VNHLDHPLGMFSLFNYVAGVLYEYNQRPYCGLEVNFEKSGLYYEPALGPNWWQYYCEPISLGSKRGAKIKKFNVEEFQHHAYFVEDHLTRWQVAQIIETYIKVKKPIQDKINRFVADHFRGHKVIGVHYRGTDKKHEAPRVAYDAVLDKINQYIRKNHFYTYKIFVATDEQPFIEFMQTRFGESVIVYSTLHSSNDEAVHVSSTNNYLKGEEALIDCILLSKTNYLIRTSSNLSLWSTFFNPSLQCVCINQRY
jgi:hypothetical protein